MALRPLARGIHEQLSRSGAMSSALRNEEPQDGPPKSFRRERLRISNACQACRSRKVKCDGGRPACVRCLGKGKTCTYNRDSVTTAQQTKRKPKLAPAPPIRSHVPIPTLPPAFRACSPETLSAAGPCSTPDPSSEDQDPDLDQDHVYHTAHGRFAGDVAAAIDMRAGLTSTSTSHLVPFVDAPLFGEIDLHSPHSIPALTTELPLRAYADKLVDIYWRYINPIEPVLDRELFFRDYEAVYSMPDRSPPADRDIWLSMLNVVFALAAQRQESTPSLQRDEEGNHYFRRAWALLRPETILWKPGSLELVQCLMLMNRYLHCTNNQQKTWMTAGLAIRIAQSLCYHVHEPPSTGESRSHRQLKRQIWASCVALDRCVTWSLGKTSMPSLISFPSSIHSATSNGSHEQGSRNAENIARCLELHEIGNQIQLAQTQIRNGLAARLGLPRLYQQDEYQAVAVQLDACLNKWENNLPSDWKLQNLHRNADRASRAERYLLHLRLLHSRIFLCRPMLARCYLTKSHRATSQTTTQETPNSPSLSDRLVREFAGMCVGAAQKVTSLIIEILEPNEPLGLLPWWYRVYYLHIAGINFLAAMFTSDLFTESVSQSWQSVMSALRAHEHLSAYVRQCICTFETLSSRILETRYSTPCASGREQLDEETSGFFYDIFQDVDCDFDDFLFGAGDVMND